MRPRGLARRLVERRYLSCALSAHPRDCGPLSGVCAGMLLVFLLKGLLVGVLIALPVGPVGILCIRRTIFHGPLAGFVSGLGAATADAVFGIIAGFGLTFLSDLLLDHQRWLR